MSSAHGIISALAVGLLIACGEPPNRGSASDAPSAQADVANVPSGQTQSARSVPDDDGDDCTRARREQGVLRGLRADRFEQASERREIEQALQDTGRAIDPN